MEDKPKKDQYICICVDHDKYKTLPHPKYLKRKPYEPINKKLVTAFIPGLIRKVVCQNNKKVVKGQVLLTLEAMKMNNLILAPLDGTIKKVNVKDGDLVSKNQVLVELK